jgi:hypothetical protein
MHKASQRLHLPCKAHQQQPKEQHKPAWGYYTQNHQWIMHTTATQYMACLPCLQPQKKIFLIPHAHDLVSTAHMTVMS